MQWTLKSSSKNSKDKKYMPVVKSIRKEIETASDPLLRQIMVPRITSYLEQKKNFEGNWIDSSPSNNPDFCAAGYYFAKELRRELGVPIGLIHSAYGGTRVQAWVPKDVYAEGTTMSEYYQTMYDDVKEKQAKWDPEKLIKYNKKLKEIKDWKLQQRLARKRPVEPMLNKHNPSTLFNAMITPLVPYGMKGVLWYQGESNTKHLTDQYVNYKKALISSWRKHWGQGDFPFYFTQLANFKKVKVDPLEEDVWASLCDEQRRCLTIPNTGMAVANDIGEADDIHPKNKIDVGKRLALWALAKDYGREELVHSGPLYKDCSFEGAEVSVRFDSVGEGLMVAKKDLLDPAREVDEAVKGFQICGEDRQWVWAKAEISSKDSVKVFHPSVKEPVELRYAWAANPPAANLYNRSGLPTSCFKCSKL
jgi:sialate O-acetylesterase